MNIETYSDFIVERQEFASIVTIAATWLVYFKFGFLAALVPCASFHLGAYLGYRRFQKTQFNPPKELTHDRES